MTIYEIPLLAQPQTLTVTLAGVQYGLTVRWCDPLGGWTLDISDSAGTPIATNIALVTGVDLLGQLKYLGIAGVLCVLSGGDALTDATFDDLGSTVKLYFIPS